MPSIIFFRPPTSHIRFLISLHFEISLLAFPTLRWGCWTSTSDRRPPTRCRRGWRTCSPWWCPGSCLWRGPSTPQSECLYMQCTLFETLTKKLWSKFWTQPILVWRDKPLSKEAWERGRVRRYSTEFEDLQKPITNATDLLDNNTKATQWVAAQFLRLLS